MDDLNDIVFFTAVAENRGFSAAARALRAPKSSVSRHVSRLEARLEVRLFERSTRSIRLTEAGAAYYARCKAILKEIEDAESDVAQLRADPKGIIRVSCPVGLSQSVLARVLPGFLSAYPLVRVQLVATNRTIDLVEERVDVAIRVRMQIDDEALMMRRLRSDRLIFVGSAVLLAGHRAVSSPEDLAGVPFLSFQQDTPRPHWTLTGPNGATRVMGFDPVLWTSDFSVLVEAAAAGVGVALLPTHVTDGPLKEGRLVRVLPGWQSEEVTIHLVFTSRRGLSPALRVFIDYLAEHFGETAPQRVGPIRRTKKRSRA
jgi:DNA-binding transcriptional LysR family regulator